jgi:probable rRNA maturation factor
LFNVTLLKSSRTPRGAYATKDLEALASFVFSSQKVRKPVDLTIDIVGHRRIRELNRHYRGVDRTTDVISFRDDISAGRHGGLPLLVGDIAINVAQAATQAKRMHHPLRREVRLLLIHAILHLLGYTDYEPGPRRRMFQRQNALLLNWDKKHR